MPVLLHRMGSMLACTNPSVWCQTYCQPSVSVHPPYAAAKPAFQVVPTVPYKTKSCLSILPCRMGRMLIRMVCSRDFSLGSNMLPAMSLIWATIVSRCSSCQPTYLLLGLIVCCTILTCMASWLLQPVSMSTDDDLLMQVWAIPYMSDPIWLCDPDLHNSISATIHM